jgi:hypothetical protein
MEKISKLRLYEKKWRTTMRKAPLLVAGVVFALVALVHLARLILHFPLVIGELEVPLSVNVIGFFVTAFLSVWMFISAKKS